MPTPPKIIELRRERLSFEYPPDMSGTSKTQLCLSNRLVLSLKTESHTETIVLRAQNMHLCLNMAARIAKDFDKLGPLSSRTGKTDWEDIWNKLIQGYEYNWNFSRWITIYSGGKVLFDKGPGTPPPQLNRLEEIIFEMNENYKMALAEFHRQISTDDQISVTHKSSLALKAEVTDNHQRCSMLCRAAQDSNIVTIIGEAPEDAQPFNLHGSLAQFGDYQQGFQYAFMLGMTTQNIEQNKIPANSSLAEQEQHKLALIKELARLSTKIDNLKSLYTFHYRPEEPDFEILTRQAQGLL